MGERNEVLSVREDVLPGRAEVLPDREDVLPGQEEVLPGRVDVLPDRAEVRPDREGAPEYGPQTLEELFPCGCTVCLNDGKLGRSISTAGADSIYSNQAVFEVLGMGFG